VPAGASNYPPYNSAPWSGDWTRTINVYSKLESGDTIPGDGGGPIASIQPYPADPDGYWFIQSDTISEDGTQHVREYVMIRGGGLITETDTVSGEYTRVQMEADADTLLAQAWPPKDYLRHYSYEIGTGNIIGSDQLLIFATPLESYFVCLGYQFWKQRLRPDVTLLWSVLTNRTPNFLGPVDPAHDESCATYTSANCAPHEIEIPVPPATDTSPGKYVGRNILSKMKSCA
jgi:hypothetical protein